MIVLSRKDRTTSSITTPKYGRNDSAIGHTIQSSTEDMARLATERAEHYASSAMVSRASERALNDTAVYCGLAAVATARLGPIGAAFAATMGVLGGAAKLLASNASYNAKELDEKAKRAKEEAESAKAKAAKEAEEKASQSTKNPSGKNGSGRIEGGEGPRRGGSYGGITMVSSPGEADRISRSC